MTALVTYSRKQTAPGGGTWTPVFSGAGPHTLLVWRNNRYDNSASSFTLVMPAVVDDGDEVEITGVAVSGAGPVQLEGGIDEFGTMGFAESYGIAVAGRNLDPGPTYSRYKWDAASHLWQLVGSAVY